MLRPMISWPTHLGTRHPHGVHDQTLITIGQETSSLMRGQVCNLLVQFLLSLASAVTFESKFHRIHNPFFLSHLRLSSQFAGFCDSQGYGGSILITALNTMHPSVYTQTTS